MDLNKSVLAAATLLVPRRPTPAPAAPSMPLWAHNSWVCLFTAMLAVAIGGNAIVIWIVIAHRRMRTVTNYFLVNLSVADLMMAALNCLFNFIYMLHSDWVFGVWYCQLSNFIANVTVAASVFTLTGISFDRSGTTNDQYKNLLVNLPVVKNEPDAFWCKGNTLIHFSPPISACSTLFQVKYQAIVRPMRPRMSKTSSLVMIAAIWFGGMFLATPCLLYSTTKEYSFDTCSSSYRCPNRPISLLNIEVMTILTLRYRSASQLRSKETIKTACLLAWPDGLPDVSYMDFVTDSCRYQVLFFVVTYAVPMLGMTFFYSAMGRVLWGSRSIGELTQRQIDSIRSKRKVVRMFILVIVIFGICWLPYQSYFIYTHFDPSILYKKYIQHLYLGFY
ncbi:Tachykinin-like peptides receptor 86C [Eumeta japonica]|uniref:Tachykinin-like peptides receptor 86C n=1 Tax=Eumeta variegata TaxID=151549 RepID=A0A4C1TUB7_EUMVA|nr:Tachykinin-like peptides receptor 86C [Eumeta japonica]